MIEIRNLNTTNLESIGLSQTSKGVLLKWNSEDKYYKSGALHYGIFSRTHPVVECICSKIRKKLGLIGVDYKLESIKSKGCEDFEAQEILCCVSDNFLKPDETLITFAKHYKNYNQKLTYIKLLEDFKEFEEEINQTLMFDFIVNNIDRHYINLNNTNEEFIEIIHEYEDYLGKERSKAMIKLLEERLDYVRKLYSNV